MRSDEGASAADWAPPPARGRGFGGFGKGKGKGKKGKCHAGHDDRVTRVVNTTHVFKTRRGGIANKGRGRGKGDNLYRPPGMRDGSGGPGGTSSTCRDFQRNGSCQRGDRCHFQHARIEQSITEKVDAEGIARHCEVKAHEGAICAIAMTEQGIYTASQDKSLKRWKPQKDATGRYQLTQELNVPLDDGCFSMYCAGGWIFCGLWSGNVKAFSQDGVNTDLRGHTKRVTAIIQHQGILITGSVGKDVRLWAMDVNTKVFTCSHTLTESMPGPINCLQILGGNLWVGGMSGIAVVDLASLKVTKLLPPTRSVTSFLEFQGHVVAAYGDGGLRVFDAEGTMKSEMPNLAAGSIQAIGGLESGPRLLCGHAHGQVSTITLPDFNFKTQFQAMLDTSIESLMCAGQDGLFLLGCKKGNLQLWQRMA